MTVDLGRSLIVHHSLTFDLCCVTGSLIFIIHVIACWMLAPSILHSSPYIFLQTPLAPPSLPPLNTSSPVTPSALTSKPFFQSDLATHSADGATHSHLANQRPTTKDTNSREKQAMVVYVDDNSTPVAASNIEDGLVSNWTIRGRFVTAPHEGGNTPSNGEQSIAHVTPLPFKEDTSMTSDAMTERTRDSRSSCSGPGFDPSLRRYLTKLYFSFCITSTVLTSFEVVRCVIMCQRHRNMLKNDVDGLPYKGMALFDVFLPEFLLFFLLLADDLPISGLILASQTSIGCDLTVSASGTALFVAVATTAVASSWKLCVILWRLGRRRGYYGNGGSRRNDVLLVIVRVFSLLLITLSLVLVAFNFLLMSGSKDLLTSNPLLHRLFRGAGSRFWFVDDGWISLIVRRKSSEETSNRSSSSEEDFPRSRTSFYVTSTPVIRWRDLLVLPPDTGSTVISVQCFCLEDWFLVASGFHRISTTEEDDEECSIYFRFNFLGQGQIGYNAWYCIVPRRTTSSSAYQSGQIPTKSQIEWNCTDGGKIPLPTDSSSSESTCSVENLWNIAPAPDSDGENETCWFQLGLGFWPMVPASPLWTDCHYHFTQHDFIVPETPCDKRP